MKITLSHPRDLYHAGAINHFPAGQYEILDKELYEPEELTPYMVGVLARMGWIEVEKE